jgi:hypothetical protein
MALVRYCVSIPFLLEYGAIFVQGVKEEKMDQPKMVWVGAGWYGPIHASAQVDKKKARQRRANCEPTSTQSHSMRVL